MNKPNVLLLFADQHQAACMGYENHPDVLTPNLDALAHNGVRFSRAYCQDGICVPSRISCMSGLYPRTIGVLDNGDSSPVLDKAIPLQQTLQANGYTTAAFGKRHLGGDHPHHVDRGWDQSISHLSHEDKYAYVHWLIEQGIDNDKESRGYGRPHIQNFADDWAAEFRKGPPGAENTPWGDFGPNYKSPGGDLGTKTSMMSYQYTMEAFTARKTIELIKNRKSDDKPFFVWSSFYRPHQPYNPQQRFLDEYLKKNPQWLSTWGNGFKNNSSIKMPATLRQNKNELPPFLSEWRDFTESIWNLKTAAENEQLYRNYIGGYYALVTEIDYWIGEIVQALRDTNQLENTIILYTTDHGDFAGSHGMVEKCALGHSMYEETYRVPLLFHWQNNFLKGAENKSLTELLDVYPTLLELTGIQKQNDGYPLAGKSLLPALTRGESAKRDYIVVENWSSRTVITDRYKLSEWTAADKTLENKTRFAGTQNYLFDRQETDPADAQHNPLETVNHYNDPAFAAIRKELSEKLQQWEQITNAEGRDYVLTQARANVKS